MFTKRNDFCDKMYLMRNEFGDWLRSERENRGLSQADLARLANLNRAVINKIESGTRPTPDTLKSIAKGLKLPEGEVMRAAGILSQIPKASAQKEELNYLFDQLNNNDQKTILDMMRFLLSK